MAHPQRIRNMLKRNGLSGVNKPKRTPRHKTKAAVVLAFSDGKYKLIRFGQQGAKQEGKNPRTARGRKRRKSFKARHAKNIKRGKLSAAFWADKFLW